MVFKCLNSNLVEKKRKKGKIMDLSGFGTTKDLIEWLDHETIHPDVTADVIRKRVKRKWNLEKSLCESVVKPIRASERKERKVAKVKKARYREKMFKMAQDVRKEYSQGKTVPEISEERKLKKSMVYRIVCRYEWYNRHWKTDYDNYDIKKVVRKNEQ